MKSKILIASCLIVLNCMLIQAQKKKSAAPAKTQTAAKTGKAFYKTPYASRNSGSFDKSAHLISLTYGFPNTLDYAGFLYGGNDKSIGPVNFRYEFPIRDEAGVGLSVAGAKKEWDFGEGYSTDVTGISISPLGFYHFNKLIPVAKLDVFAGVGANVNIISYKYSETYADDDEVEVYPTALVGARYYFTDSFSGIVEAGGGSFAFVKFGLSFKL